MDSLELLEGRRRADDDPDVVEAYARTLVELGFGDFDAEHFDAALVWFELAGEALKSLVQDPRGLEAIVRFDRARRDIAAELGRRGLEGQRRKLLEAHLRMLEHPRASRDGDPAIGLLAALTRAELADDDGAIATLRAAIRRFPADRRLPELLEASVGDWIVRDVNPYPSGRNPNGEPMGRLDPEAHADLVIQSLESRCEALGFDPSLLPAVATKVANIAASRGSEQRAAGLLDEARRTAACLSAFAQRLTRRDPGEAAFHLLLGQAFEQKAKNAWKLEDSTGIRQGFQKALGEARTALSLDPRNIDAERWSRSSRTSWSVCPPSHRHRGEPATLADLGFTPGLNGRPFEAGLAGRYMRVKRMFAAVHGRSPLPRPPVPLTCMQMAHDIGAGIDAAERESFASRPHPIISRIRKIRSRLSCFSIREPKEFSREDSLNLQLTALAASKKRYAPS